MRVSAFTINISGVNAVQLIDNTYDYIDVDQDNVLLSTQGEVKKAHLYIRTDATIIDHGELNDYVEWYIIDDCLIVHTVYGDLDDNSTNRRDVVIDDFTPTGANPPWYSYLVDGTIKRIAIDEGITAVGDYAFYTPIQNSVCAIMLPYGLQSIGEYSFANTSIRCQYLPNSVTSFEPTAIYGCDKFTEFVCDNNNSSTFYTDDGLLYKKNSPDQHLLIAIPGGLTDAKVVDDCTKIGIDAAYGAKLKSVDLNNVTEIDQEAFKGSNLESLLIPKSITISQNAFSECKSLSTLTFGNDPESIISVTLGDNAFGQTLDQGETNSILQIDLRYGTVTSFGSGCLPTGNFYRDGVTPVDVSSDYSQLTSGSIYTRESAYLRNCSQDEGLKFYIQTIAESRILNILYIDGNGVMLDYDSKGAPWNRIASTLTTINLPDGIVKIGDYAFQDASAVGTIGMKDSCETLGVGAFMDCTSLSSIDLKNIETIGSSAFEGCTSLATVTMNEVETIPESAFKGCSSLSRLNSSTAGKADLSSITAVGQDAFKGCSSLTSVSLDSLTTVPSGAFQSCSSLSEVSFGSSLTSVGNDAFKSTAIKQLIFPRSLQTVGIGSFDSIAVLDTISFQGTSSDTAATITATSFPERADMNFWYLNGIDDTSHKKHTLYAFNNGSITKGTVFTVDAEWTACGAEGHTSDVRYRYISATKTLYLAGQSETLSNNVLSDYTSGGNFKSTYAAVADATTLVVNNIPELSTYVFYNDDLLTDLHFSGTSIAASAFEGCDNLGHAEISATTSIAANAFKGCGALEEVLLGSSVAVGNSAFKGDIALTNAKIDLSKIGTIGNNAFQDCTGLTSAPVSSATTIGKEAFKGCTGLTSVDLSDSLISVGATPFSGLTAMPTISVEGVAKGTLISADYSPMVTKDALQAMLAGTNTEYGQYAQLFADIDSSSITMTKNANDKNLDLYGHVLKVSKSTNTNLHGNITVADSYTSGASTHRYFSYTEGAGWTDTGATSSSYTAYTLGQGAIMVSGVPEGEESIMLYGKNYTETDVAYNVAKANLTDLTAVLTYKGEVFTADQVKDQFSVKVDDLKLTLNNNYTVSMAEITRNGTVDNKNVGNVYVVLQSKDPSMDSGNLLLEIAKKNITVTFPEHINYGDEPIDKLVMTGAYETAKVIFSGDDALQELSLASKYIGTTTLTLVGPDGHPMSTANYNIVSYFNLTEGPFITSVTIDSVTFTVSFYKLNDSGTYDDEPSYQVPVVAPNPLMLPSAGVISGKVFAGWYTADPTNPDSGAVMAGLDNEYFPVEEDGITLYAKYSDTALTSTIVAVTAIDNSSADATVTVVVIPGSGQALTASSLSISGTCYTQEGGVTVFSLLSESTTVTAGQKAFSYTFTVTGQDVYSVKAVYNAVTPVSSLLVLQESS